MFPPEICGVSALGGISGLEWSVWLVDFCEGILDPLPTTGRKKTPTQTKTKSNLLQSSRDQSMQVSQKEDDDTSIFRRKRCFPASHSPVDTGSLKHFLRATHPLGPVSHALGQRPAKQEHGLETKPHALDLEVRHIFLFLFLEG